MYLKKHRLALKMHGHKYLYLLPLNFLLISSMKTRAFLQRNTWKCLRLVARKLTHRVKILESYIKPKEVRRHLLSTADIEQLFATFKERNVKYCILRWFENLPDWPENEDIDILIAPEDEHKVSDLFCYNNKAQKIDLYSYEGQLEYKNTPYYSYNISIKLLNEAIVKSDLYRVPDTTNHLNSLIYHVVFHKGAAAGIPLHHNAEKPEAAEHDYLQVLAPLCHQANVALPTTYIEMLDHLETQSWLPPCDTAYKYADQNPLLKQAFQLKDYFAYNKDWEGEILVFVLREWAAKHNYIGQLEKWFQTKDHKIELVEHIILDPDESEYARRNIRGGNWSKGPYAKSGGSPYSFLVFYDYAPSQSRNLQRPGITNTNYQLKLEIRNLIHAGQLAPLRANFIHSSDNEHEALCYLQHLKPERKNTIIDKVKQRSIAYETKNKKNLRVVNKLHSNESRAKIELIEIDGKPHIKKTFRPTKLRYFEREKLASTELSLENKYILPASKVGDNYIVTPYIDDVLSDKSKKEKTRLLKQHGEQVVDFIKTLHEQGYFLIDFKIDNLLLAHDGSLYVTDFEFLYPYNEKPCLAKSYNLVGTPKDLQVDLPDGYQHPGYTYNNHWKKIIKPMNA